MNCIHHANIAPEIPRLLVRMLGEWQVVVDGQPLEHKLYGKVVALAGCLFAQPGRSITREYLASTLWPRLPAAAARTNLRQALRHLRQALGPSARELLEVTRDTLRFVARSAHCSIDVAMLNAALPECNHKSRTASHTICEACTTQLESRLALYRGDFLAGLHINDAPEFEAWLNAQRQHLRERAFLMAERLCDSFKAADKPEKALACAQRCIELEPWNEAAHRKYMGLLADLRRFATVPVHYDTYLANFAEDTDSPATAGTHALFESIHKVSLTARHPQGVSPRDMPVPARAHWRHVTILCCHLKVQPNTPESRQEQLSEARSVCAAVLRRYAGHLSQGPGGYIFAYMGYPAALEQAARHAIQASLELQSLFGPPYSLRIGIHSDTIIAGTDPAIPDSIGSASSEAWRLCRRLRENGTLVSHASAQLLHGQFRLQPLAHPGKTRKSASPSSRPSAFYLPTPQDHHSRPPASAPSSPILGRETELRHLRKLWHHTRQGNATFLVLRGEPGIGKTRLAHEICNEAQQQDAQVRHLHCYPEHRHTPLYPVIALLDAVMGLSPDDTAGIRHARLQAFLSQYEPVVAAAAEPVLKMLCSIPNDVPLPSPQQRKKQTLDTLLLLLKSLASTRPLLMVIEDAQWLDATSLDLLERLSQDKEVSGLFSLVTARTAFRPVWLADDAVLELEPLPDADIARLVLAANRSLPSQAIDSIVRRAEGIPFYAEQLAHVPAGTHGTGGSIPATLHDLLLARLETAPEAQRTLQIAATIGRRFGLGMLRHTSGLDPVALERILQRLQDARIICSTEFPDHVFQFKHALLQETAYASQVQADRQEAHHRIAQTIRVHYPQLAAQQPAEIARHYSAGNDPVAAIPYWLSAGRMALAVSAATEAESHLQQGLRMAEHLPLGEARTSQEVTLLLLLAQATQLRNGYGSHTSACLYDRAFELSNGQLPLKQRFEILWGLWTVANSRPDYGFLKAHELSKNLLALAIESHDHELLAKAHTANANVALWLDQPHNVRRHAEACLASASTAINTLGGLDPIVATQAYLSWAYWKQGRVPDALAASKRSVARARSLKNPDSLCLALGFSAMLQRFLDNTPAVASQTEEMLALANACQLATWQGLGRMLQAWVSVKAGDDGGVHVLQACANTIQHVMPSVAGIFFHALAEALGLLHRFDEQLQVIEKGVALSRCVDERFFGSMLEHMLIAARHESRQAHRKSFPLKHT